MFVAGPLKRKRGVVVGLKTKETVRLTKSKIVIEWDEQHNMPADQDLASQLTRDIGMKVKDDIPMLASVYGDLNKDHKAIVYNYLYVSVQVLIHLCSFIKCFTSQLL